MKKPALFTIFLIIFIDLLGFGILIPLSPFLAQHFGASPLQYGLLMASYSLMQFLVAPLWGALSDKIGRRPILLFSTLGSFISYFIFGTAQSLWMLFAARLFQGACAANIGVAQAYVADITTKEDRSKGMGVVGAGIGLGFVMGPAIGALLVPVGHKFGVYFDASDNITFKMGFPALGASLVSLCNFFLAYVTLPESLTKELRAKAKEKKISRLEFLGKSLSRRQLGWLMVSLFFSTFALTQMEASFALFCGSRLNYGVVETGLMLAFVGVIMVVTQGYIVRKYQSKWGDFKLILWGLMFSALGMGLITLAYSTQGLMLAMMVVAVGSGLSNPALLGSISRGTSENEQGAMMGLNQSLSSMARILGPIFGTFLFERSVDLPFISAGLICVVLAFVALRNHSHMPPHSAGR